MFTEFGIQLGPLSIHWYAVIIMSGAMLALFLATREAQKFGATSEDMIDLFFLFMIFGIIGARIYYVAFEPGYLAGDFMRIFRVWEGGIAIYGGIIGAAIVGIIYANRKKINKLLLADIIMPVVLLAQGIGRWGNFVNIEAYGGVVPGATIAEQAAFLKGLFIPDFIIERMFINGNYHHPTFLYESLWNVIGFLIIFFIIRKRKELKLGVQTCMYFIWYGIGRYFIEGMRTDSLYLFANVRVSQVVSIILVIVGIIGIIYIYRDKKRAMDYQDATFFLENNTENIENNNKDVDKEKK